MAYNKAWGDYIPNGTINDTIATWHADKPDFREQTCATPSSLLECPRVIWLKKHKVEPTNKLGWGKKQRFMLGRVTENLIAEQLKDTGKLLYHWKDDYHGESVEFHHGEGLDAICGTPDLLIQLDKVAISDSKTSRSDSFKYVPIDDDEIWQDPYWYRYRLQLTAYYMLCHWNKGWFETMRLPLPEVCHLFSYALDDGIVRRELTWEPEQADFNRVKQLIRRWNEAYASEEMPDCTCAQDDTVKFCAYGICEDGKKVCDSCCHEDLGIL